MGTNFVVLWVFKHKTGFSNLNSLLNAVIFGIIISYSCDEIIDAELLLGTLYWLSYNKQSKYVCMTFDSSRIVPDSQNLKLLVIPPYKLFAVCRLHYCTLLYRFSIKILQKRYFSRIILNPISELFTDSTQLYSKTSFNRQSLLTVRPKI